MLLALGEYDNTLDWMGASDQCLKMGGYLASIHSLVENEFLATMLNHGRAWIGMNSRHDGHWKWLDRTTVAYQRWSPGGKPLDVINEATTDQTNAIEFYHKNQTMRI